MVLGYWRHVVGAAAVMGLGYMFALRSLPYFSFIVPVLIGYLVVAEVVPAVLAISLRISRRGIDAALEAQWRRALSRDGTPPVALGATPEAVAMIDGAPIAGGDARIDDMNTALSIDLVETYGSTALAGVRSQGSWIVTSDALWCAFPRAEIAVRWRFADVASIELAQHRGAMRELVRVALENGRTAWLSIDTASAVHLRVLAKLLMPSR